MSSTQLYQLMKLPLLVKHYMEHKQQNRNITLYSFLSMHYAHGVVVDKDYDKDMKLPFKVDDKSVSTDITNVQPDNISAFIEKPIYNNTKTFIYFDEMFIPSSFLSNIWQPPKTC